MFSRDRLILLAAALPVVLGFGIAFGITGNFTVATTVGGVACLVAAAISLTPPVQRAHMRLLRRRYPDGTGFQTWSSAFRGRTYRVAAEGCAFSSWKNG